MELRTIKVIKINYYPKPFWRFASMRCCFLSILHPKYQKIKFIVLFTALLLDFTAQNELNKYDCNYVKKAIETEIFQNHFFIAKRVNYDLIILDTNYFFEDCKNEIIKNRLVKHEYKTNKKIDKDIILIYKVEAKEKNVLVISFLQPHSNANLILRCTKISNGMKIETIAYGVF